ncbi:MAG: hypothetical protein J6R04_06545, partial [Clostridia bacterium]|nr:hypothetical protein [Clostridia bacterium]
MSTENAKKISDDGGTAQFSRKADADGRASGDFSELLASAGIVGEAIEIQNNLAELERMAKSADADEVQVRRFAASLALTMAREGTLQDGETREKAANRIERELLARVGMENAGKGQVDKDGPKVKKTGYTYDDVH